MTKWADFVVSAIQKGSGLSNISHVQIHEDLEHGLTAPRLMINMRFHLKYKKEFHLSLYLKKMKMNGLPAI